MNKIILPNARWVSLTSESNGSDWLEKSQLIDSALFELGMDLAEEAVFVLFDAAPGSVLTGEANCQVARSVIGPKRKLPSPFKLVDWSAANVYTKTLKTSTWQEVLDSAYHEWEDLQRRGEKIDRPFFLCLRRKLVPELVLEIDLVFTSL